MQHQGFGKHGGWRLVSEKQACWLGTGAPSLQHTTTGYPKPNKAIIVLRDDVKLIAQFHPTTAATIAISSRLCFWHAN